MTLYRISCRTEYLELKDLDAIEDLALTIDRCCSGHHAAEQELIANLERWREHYSYILANKYACMQPLGRR